MPTLMVARDLLLMVCGEAVLTLMVVRDLLMIFKGVASIISRSILYYIIISEVQKATVGA